MELTRQGFALAAEGGGIRVAPAGRLTPELRQAVRAHKPGLLALLTGAQLDAVRTEGDSCVPTVPTVPWDEVAAALLVQQALGARERCGYSPDPAVRHRQGRACDAVDRAWLGRDLPRLRGAVRLLLDLLRLGQGPGPAADAG
jgi:hypothetical protein